MVPSSGGIPSELDTKEEEEEEDFAASSNAATADRSNTNDQYVADAESEELEEEHHDAQRNSRKRPREDQGVKRRQPANEVKRRRLGKSDSSGYRNNNRELRAMSKQKPTYSEMLRQQNARPTTSTQVGNNADFVAVESVEERQDTYEALSGEERQDTYEILEERKDTYEPNDDAARMVTPVPNDGGAHASTIANPTNAVHELAMADQRQANGNAEGARAARDNNIAEVGMITNEESIVDDPNVIGSGALWDSIEKTVGSSMIRSVSKLVEGERPGLNDFMENDYANGAIGLQRRTVETLSKVIDQQNKIAICFTRSSLKMQLLCVANTLTLIHYTFERI